jgi:hypothetical protein
MHTVSYIAKPQDSRCQWWAVRIPADYQIADLTDTHSLRPLGFLRKGADLELAEGEAVIESEAVHHRRQRGYDVQIGIVSDGKFTWHRPGSSTKAAIKAWASPEQWQALSKGSGDVAACLRLLLAMRQGFRQPVAAMVPAQA